MVVECSHCGAPLDVREGATLTKCGYCGRTDERKNLRTIHQATPKEFVPPPRWRPPAHVPDASSDEYEYKRETQWTPFWIVFVSTTVVLGVAIPLVMALRHAPPKPASASAPTEAPVPVRKVDPRVLDTIALDGNEGELKKRFGGREDEWGGVAVDVLHDTWNKVVFAYTFSDGSHPTSVVFQRTRGFSTDDVARISSALGLPLRAGVGGAWQWSSLDIRIGEKALLCGVNPRPKYGPADPNWKRRIVVAYSVLKEAVYGQKSTVSMDERHELLGLPFALADLARVEPSTSVDAAESTVRKLLPGVIVTQGSSLKLFVNVAHTRVAKLTMAWPNTKDAKMSTVFLEQARNLVVPYLADIAHCFEKPFGTPTTREVDYLKKKKNYEFRMTGARLSVSENELRLTSDADGKAIPQTIWTTFLTTLEACR